VDDRVTMGPWLHLTNGTNLLEILNKELGLDVCAYFSLETYIAPSSYR
jgi:hypothetical protein